MSRRRAEELLAFSAVEGLSQAQHLELAALLDEMPELDDRGFEQAAVACHLALLGPEEPLPDALRQRLESEAVAMRRTLWTGDRPDYQ